MAFIKVIQKASVLKTVPQARNMATLKEISIRLKSIQNIAKITKSMKMIASTKVTKAQRFMEQARIYGGAATAILNHVELGESKAEKPLVVTVSSDRGLCGGIHSAVSKATKKILNKQSQGQVAILGMKAKSQIQREHRQKIAVSFDGVTKNLPSWFEASLIADLILSQKTPTDSTQIVYNKFRSVIAFDTTVASVPSLETLKDAPKLKAYEVEDDVLENYQEFLFANTLYWAIAEGYASEMCAKRTAMENATKNAGEMIQKLTLTYNRSRQATITNELIDIITGASAM